MYFCADVRRSRKVMIERYTRPEMARIWSEDNKIATWLRVEVLVCEAWAREGVIPADALERIKGVALDLERMHEIEQ